VDNELKLDLHKEISAVSVEAKRLCGNAVNANTSVAEAFAQTPSH